VRWGAKHRHGLLFFCSQTIRGSDRTGVSVHHVNTSRQRGLVVFLPTRRRVIRSLIFAEQATQGHTEDKVVNGPEVGEAQAPHPVDHERRRGAPEPVLPHRDGNRMAVVPVDADREVDPELGQEYLESVRPRHLMMLEDGVDADDRDFRERALHTLRLGQAIADAAGAEHLERLEQHHPAAQRFERGRRAYPGGYVQFGSQGSGGNAHRTRVRACSAAYPGRYRGYDLEEQL
jgi:hypothetical protein